MRAFIYLITIFIIACDGHRLPSGSDKLKFDAIIWKDERSVEFDGTEPTQRQQMLQSLISKYLEGKSRKQVISLLGVPSSKMDPDGKGSSLSYPTGPQRDSYFAIDYEWLIIEFNSEGIYEDYYLASD